MPLGIIQQGARVFHSSWSFLPEESLTRWWCFGRQETPGEDDNDEVDGLTGVLQPLSLTARFQETSVPPNRASKSGEPKVTRSRSTKWVSVFIKL